MNARQIAAFRFIGWIIVALAVLFSIDFQVKDSVDRLDVETVSAVLADAESNGDWCWTGGSDLEPDYVIFSRSGKVEISQRRVDIDNAIEQGVFDIDHGIDPGFAFCVTDGQH